MILAWLVAIAHAVYVDVCIDINTDFADAAPDVATVHDDYLHDNDVQRPIRGVKIEVIDTSVTPNDTESHFANSTGPAVGCATFDLITGHTHTIRMKSVAEVGDGHHIEVRAGPGLGVYAKQWTDSFVAPATATTEPFVQNGGQVWGILTVAAWALHHRDGGLSNEDWTLYNQDCPGLAGGYCFSCDPDQDTLNASDCFGGTDTNEVAAVFVGTDKRYIIAHELGHYLMNKRNEGGGGGNSSTADAEGCYYATSSTTGHEYQSKEWLAEAFWEGFASFYAAVTFNAEDESDCFVHYYKDQNYDLDSDEDPSAFYELNATGVNCSGIPEKLPDGTWPEPLDPLSSTIGAFDYLDDCVNGMAMGGDIVNRGTELDFVRFAFDLYQLSTWTLVDIVDVYDAANPHQWIGASDTDPDPNNSPALPTPTFEEVLNDPAFSLLEPDWTVFAAVHGVDR